MRQKSYDGYKSFQYLEPEVDYRPFRLAKDLGRVAPWVYPVDEAQERLVQQILEEETIVSVHDHIFVTPEDVSEIFEYNRLGRNWTGYEGLSRLRARRRLRELHGRHGDDHLQVRLEVDRHHPRPGHPLQRLCPPGDDVQGRDAGRPLRGPSPRAGSRWSRAIESATPIENEVDRVDVLYGFGVRVMGITYSESNGAGLRAAGDERRRPDPVRPAGRPAHEQARHDDRRLALRRQDRRRIRSRPARSRCSSPTSGARALWDTNRLKPDWVLKACAEKGGVIGIEAAPHTTLTREAPACTPSSRTWSTSSTCANLVGIDHVAFGPDTLFGDHVGLHHAFAAALSIAQPRGRTYRSSRRCSTSRASRTRRGLPQHRALAGEARLQATRRSPKLSARTRCACSEETWAR